MLSFCEEYSVKSDICEHSAVVCFEDRELLIFQSYPAVHCLFGGDIEGQVVVLICGNIYIKGNRSLSLAAEACYIAVSAEFGKVKGNSCTALELAAFCFIEISRGLFFYLGIGNGVIGVCLDRQRSSRLCGGV